MSARSRCCLVVILTFGMVAVLVSRTQAQQIAEPPGPFILAGGRDSEIPRAVREAFLKLAGDKNAKVVVIPTAVADRELREPDKFLQPWRALKPLSIEMMHTRDPKMADDPAFVKPLTEATAVWFTNGHPDRVLLAYRGTLVERELRKLHTRGGLVGGTDSGTAVLCDLVIDRVEKGRLTESGLGVLSGFLIDDDGRKGRVAEAVAANPAYVGLTIDPGVAVEICGQTLRVIGEGEVTLRLAMGAGREAQVKPLKPGAQLDILDLRREAASRAGNK